MPGLESPFCENFFLIFTLNLSWHSLRPFPLILMRQVLLEVILEYSYDNLQGCNVFWMVPESFGYDQAPLNWVCDPRVLYHHGKHQVPLCHQQAKSCTAFSTANFKTQETPKSAEGSEPQPCQYCTDGLAHWPKTRAHSESAASPSSSVTARGDR